MGFLASILALLIISKNVWEWTLDEKGFKVPGNKTLSLFLVLLDKVLVLRNSYISVLDSFECLNPN